MVDYKMSGSIAMSNLKSNPERGWTHANTGKSAKERIGSEDVMTIGHRPKFKIDRSWPIFTMGSCFAREIENALLRLGMPILNDGAGVEGKFFASWNEKSGVGGGVGRDELSRGALNKYTVRSMHHEIESVLLGKSYFNGGLIELKEGVWFDPHAAGLRNADYDTTLVNRQKIAASTDRIRQAKVVFLTLGLTETWLDNETGMPMNGHPGLDWLARLKDRFTFVDYGFQETLNQLDGIIQLVRDQCFSDVRFIITVSPVPLSVTFKDIDIIVANSGSKSVLRAVADEVSRKYEFVDYFPSYEIVAYSPKKVAFIEDCIHVDTRVVKNIMETFIESYYS